MPRSTDDDIDAWLPDLPFSEDELVEAYCRLYPEAVARDYAARLHALPGEMRATLRKRAAETPEFEWPRLFVGDDVFASLALGSPALRERVMAYKEAESRQFVADYRYGVTQRRAFKGLPASPDDIEQEVQRLRA